MALMSTTLTVQTEPNKCLPVSLINQPPVLPPKDVNMEFDPLIESIRLIQSVKLTELTKLNGLSHSCQVALDFLTYFGSQFMGYFL